MKHSLLVLTMIAAAVVPCAAQTVTRIEAQPEQLQMRAGESADLVILAFDQSGQAVSTPLRISGARGALQFADGRVTALRAGDFEVFVSSVPQDGGEPVTLNIPVHVAWPAVSSVRIHTADVRLFEGARVAHEVVAAHADGSARPYPGITWSSSDETIATVDAFGNVRAIGTGMVTINAMIEGVTGALTHTVVASPVMA